MKDPKETLQEIFERFDTQSTVFIVHTGYACRIAYQINLENDFKYHIFYMQGSMGLSPCIGLGLVLCNEKVNVVAINGDGGYMMHAGFGYVVANYQFQLRVNNFKQYLFDNHNCYESTGGQSMDIEIRDDDYLPGVDYTYNVSSVKEIPDRVEIGPVENAYEIKEFVSRCL